MTAVIADPWPAPHAPGPVTTTVTLPGSKSLANRALVLSALATGPSAIHRALRSRDTLLMAGALTALGAQVNTDGDDWTVTPGPLTGATDVDCGLAGTVMRFVPPVAVLANGDVRFDGDPHARNRPMGPVLDALRSLGGRIDGDRLPFTVHGAGSLQGGRVTIDASASSQFVSALLLAGARYDDGIEVVQAGGDVPSLPHIEMTIAALRARGVDVRTSGSSWQVLPGPIAALDETIEPDLSNAAPFLALAAVTGGAVTVPGWPLHTTQPGDRLREILTLMGARASLADDGLTVTGGGLHGIDYDLHDVGELTPAIAALAALADSPSTLRGIAHVRGHETDRIAALAKEINNLGGKATETADGLHIAPAPLHGGVFATYADHRMAHAGVILGLAVDGVLVENVQTTSKTFTDFPAAWSAAVHGTDAR